MNIKNIVSIFRNDNVVYIIINILVSAVGFLRSFVFIKYLDLAELGIISLIQTIIILISILQFGLINGGYRIISLSKIKEQINVNNTIFTFFALLSILCLTIWVILYISKTTLGFDNYLLLSAIISGLLSLITNWLTNLLIGRRLLRDINKINLISGTIAILALLLVPYFGLNGAAISIIIQPLIFCIVSFLLHKEFLPTKFTFSWKTIRYIEKFGFIPFVAGIFVSFNMQVERWSISSILGNEALGRFYLLFIFSTLFILIPTSLLNIFFPKAVLAYENKMLKDFFSILKKHFILLFIYNMIAIILISLFLQPLIDFLFPAHSDNTIFVYLYLPGALALVSCDPFSLFFNSIVKLNPILINGLISFILYLSALFMLHQNDMFTLYNIAITKSILNILTLIIYSLFSYKYYKRLFYVAKKNT